MRDRAVIGFLSIPYAWPERRPASQPVRIGSRRSNCVIEVQHITKRYGSVTAVDDVSFRVEQGEILGFLGPNGAGKTTTMRILTGYMPPSEGRAMVAGFDVFDASHRGEAAHRLPARNAAALSRHDGARVPRLRRADQGGAVRRAQAARRDGHGAHAVADMAERHCGKLSKGYRQRVGLAQALIHNPDVLILDEPTAGLDPKQIIETRELSAASPGITRSSSARTSSPKSRRPASASSSSTRDGSWRWTRPTT